jgi:hypothetical protein
MREAAQKEGWGWPSTSARQARRRPRQRCRLRTRARRLRGEAGLELEGKGLRQLQRGPHPRAPLFLHPLPRAVVGRRRQCRLHQGAVQVPAGAEASLRALLHRGGVGEARERGRDGLGLDLDLRVFAQLYRIQSDDPLHDGLRRRPPHGLPVHLGVRLCINLPDHGSAREWETGAEVGREGREGGWGRAQSQMSRARASTTRSTNSFALAIALRAICASSPHG